jgi:hypothetical protein
MAVKLIRITIQLINYVSSQRLFINLALHRHVPIVFLPNPPWQFPIYPIVRVLVPKTLLLVSWVKIQYTRDGEGPDL